MKSFWGALIIGSIMMTGCADKEKKAAEGLLEGARTSIEQKEYQAALAMLDSLDKGYPKQTALRRKGMSLRPLAMEGAILKELATTDSLIAVLTVENEQQKENLRFVEHPVEGYFVSSKEKMGEFIGTNGIQGRISPDGIFYIVSSTTKPVKSTAVTLRAGSEEARSKTVAHDDERNYRRNGVEVITFMSSECDTLGRFAENHRGEAMTLTFEGEKPYTMELRGEDVDRLAETYANSLLVMKSKKAQFNKARLERSLEVARNQQAKTYPIEE